MSKSILVDLDGFLAHYTAGAAKLHGQPVESAHSGVWNFYEAWGLTAEAFYAPQNYDFWANLGVWSDGFALLAAVEALVGKDRIAFLTAPVRTAGCGDGKREWFKRHVAPRGYDAFADLFIGGNKYKLAHPGVILIDDSDGNIDKFTHETANGLGWLVPRPWNRHRDWCFKDGQFDTQREIALFTNWYKGLE